MLVFAYNGAAREHVVRIRNNAETNIVSMDELLDRMNGQAMVPGENPAFSHVLGNVKFVFTIDEDPDGKLWRHLSVSITDRPSRPHPSICDLLMTELGFKDPLPVGDVRSPVRVLPDVNNKYILHILEPYVVE